MSLPTTVTYSVAVTGTPLPALSYLGETGLLPGMRVIVPVGHRQQVGIILGENKEPPTGTFTLREISQALDTAAIWSEAMMALLDWCSRYYHAPWGRVLETALPPSLRQTKIPKRNKTLTLPPRHEPQLTTLNEEQQFAFEQIGADLTRFAPWLLQGVTGSGKTEVYAHLINRVLQEGKQALLLVPEIGLTPQMLDRLTLRLGSAPLVLHSGLTDSQRGKIWRLAQTQAPLLLIGTRSAIFAPLPNLGLLIVDEEHDGSYKQQDGIRYHARDLSIMRAKLQSCPVILGSATPSLESLANVEQGKYQHLFLHHRANQLATPTLRCIDMRQQTLTGGLSAPLLSAIQQALTKEQQVLLFLNRRGYAPVLMCHHCGHTLDCPACDVPYTFHRAHPNLRCHHCGRVEHTPTNCPKCGQQNWQLVGQGTQQLEEVLVGHFPHTNMVRIDRDSTMGKNTLPNLLNDIKEGKAQLIIGTQMLAKGHDFSGIQLVAIVDVDNALFARDFRSLERLAQLVIQVAGRAGRGENLGQVLLQTHQPQHPFVQALLTQPYTQIAKALLKERKEAHLPPYIHSVWLLAEGKNLDRVKQQLEQLLQTSIQPDVHIAGPMPALMHKRQHHYRELLWCQSHNRQALHQQIDAFIAHLQTPKASIAGVRLFWDIDPQDMP